MKVTVEEKVQYYDTDCGGVVSNIAYLRFVEKARCALFDTMGMSLQESAETQLFPTVVRTEIDYKRPGRLGDQIFIEASLEKVEKARVFCRFILTRKDGKQDDFFLANSLQVISLVQMSTGRPQRIPREWSDLVVPE